jgi:hypothetical protein
VYPSRGEETDRDGHQEIYEYETEQHALAVDGR